MHTNFYSISVDNSIYCLHSNVLLWSFRFEIMTEPTSDKLLK